MFAAAAIASTPSLSALVPVAVQVVLMAFRTGSYVHKLGERLCPAQEQSESWTYIYPGLAANDAAEILVKFHESKVSKSCCLDLGHGDRLRLQQSSARTGGKHSGQ